MSILRNNDNKMGTPFFHEFKKQASFFLKEKIKTARLALTDVTPAELLTEEATNGNPWGPDTQTMGLISRAAFEVDDYWRIVEILHKRLLKFDRNNWRISYKALIILEHLLTHGPESVAEEFQSDRDVIQEMESFQYIDEKGFNWGLNVRKKSERVLKLLEKGSLLKEERDRARKLTRGIKGFGSFCERSSSTDENYRDSSFELYGRCNSHYNDSSKNTESINGVCNLGHEEPKKDLSSNGVKKDEKSNGRIALKENMIPAKEFLPRESKSLLGLGRNEPKNGFSIEEEDHPFNNSENQSVKSLLSGRDEVLQGC